MQILKLNAISDVIYKHFTQDKYQVSTDTQNPDAIIVRSAPLHELEFNPELMAIARAGAGVNNIPLERCTEHGVVVFNTPGANANAVRELVLASLIVYCRNMIPGVEWLRALKGKGDEVPKLVEKGKNQFVGPEILGKTIGVIGLGAIGVMVANAMQRMGMDVMGYDPFISVESAWGLNHGVGRALSFEEIAAKADFITIHIPLMDQTRGFINQKKLKACKKGVVLLNFARGELVETQDVIAALKDDTLSGYITDFPVDELLGVERALCIPHLGASTPESEENCANMAASQIKDYLENGNIRNSVNMPNVEMPRTGSMRVTVMHKNITNMVGQITGVLAELDVNIANMLNKSRGALAYTMLDLDESVNGELAPRLEKILGVMQVRTFY